MSANSFDARSTLQVGDESYEIFRLDKVEGSARLPYSLKVLLENLTDPKRDAAFHKGQVQEYLAACQKRSSAPETAIEWFGLLTQRREEVDRLEFSMHSEGHILESPDRTVFPNASAPKGRLVLTNACEVRQQ